MDINNDNTAIRKSVKERLGFSSNKNGKTVDTPNNKSIFERLGKVEADTKDTNESENSDKGIAFLLKSNIIFTIN